jgi:hypothetical protein
MCETGFLSTVYTPRRATIHVSRDLRLDVVSLPLSRRCAKNPLRHAAPSLARFRMACLLIEGPVMNAGVVEDRLRRVVAAILPLRERPSVEIFGELVGDQRPFRQRTQAGAVIPRQSRNPI